MLSVDACKKYVMVQVSEIYKNSEDGLEKYMLFHTYETSSCTLK